MMKKKHFVAAGLWIVAYLLIFDIGINLLLRYPKDPRNISPSTLSQFFEYGRSVEGKLARMTRPSDDQSAPILLTGWLREPDIRIFSYVQDTAHNPVITVYGMSHSVLLAEDMAKVDHTFVVRSFGAPGAVPTWSYAAFLMDKEQFPSDVAVLAIMTKGVPLIATTSGTTNHFDSVWPYTYPRFFVQDGKLGQTAPPFMSLAEYREFFYDRKKWKAYIDWLREYDRFYDPLLFRGSFLDQSSILRLIRRGYAYSSRSKKEARVFDDRNGFKIESEEVRILRAIIESFASEARKKHALPIIYLVNNVLMSDHLFKLLEPTLSSAGILYLSTHEIAPPDDPTNYLPDSHFVPAKNMELAKEMMRIIRENLDIKKPLPLAKKGNLP
jgi:hypothetical protein